MVCVYPSTRVCKTQMEFFSEMQDIEAVSTMGYDIEITAQGNTKGRAIELICLNDDIARERVFAVGDGDNDLSMRQSAGFLVAMGNAAPALKAAADYVTTSVYEDGAAKAIERFVCNKGDELDDD